jgi:hypothetical protein
MSDRADPARPLDLGELTTAIRRAIRWCGAERGIDPQIAERIVRIEIDQDAEAKLGYQLQRNLGPNANAYSEVFPRFGTCNGPGKFMGVDLYVVGTLPAPGWRVINPLMRQPTRGAEWRG